MSQISAEDLINTSPKATKELLPSPVQENMGVFSRLFRFSPLGQKTEHPKTPKEEEPPQTFYGVYIPCDSKYGPDEEILHVYTDRADALKVVKKYKKARFKALQSRQDAVAFALRGAEPTIDRSPSYAGDGLLGSDPALGASQVTSQVVQLVGGEKPSQFKGPKPQEMVQFRKSIEAGDLELVKKTVWENPRYLVSSGDTPSILQEGSRYNALHVAVKAMNVEMCDFLLTTISDPQFVQLLFGDDNIESSKTRAAILLDLYLNMPDKAMNETPLHFASKFGAKEIVDLLVSYPQCSRQVKNKFVESPNDVICSRAKVKDSKLSSEIAFMLRERFYVPVLHSEDSSCQPIIGEPFSPASPPSFNNNPISPRVEIRAFAGPMDKADAITFKQKWKTPPRSGNCCNLAKPRFRLQDIEKGLEKAGRDLAQQLEVPWSEHWAFLDTFTNLSSTEGLGFLEDYLKNKYIAQWNNSTNSVNFPDSFVATPKTPKDVTQDEISTSPKKELENGVSPVTDLCQALQSCNLSDNGSRYKSNCARLRRISDSRNNQFIADDEAIMNSFINPGLSPYLCIEKSCLVFAKRIGLGLAHSLTTETVMVTECLKSEAKHLQQTVASYMDDPRFHTVDFPLIHSRVAQVIAQRLKFDMAFNDNDDLDSIKASLKEISLRNEKVTELYSSDEEDFVPSFRNNTKDHKEIKSKKSKDVNAQMKCLADSILQWLSKEEINVPIKTLATEEECIDVWSSLHKCYCPWQTEEYFKNFKNSSTRRSQMKNKYRGDGLSSSPKSMAEFVSRRLRFDSDGDSKDDSPNVLGTSPKSDKNHNLQSNGDVLSHSPNTRASVFLNEKPNSKPVDCKPNNKCKFKDEENVSSTDDESESDSDDDTKFCTPFGSPSLTPKSESSGESDYEDADTNFEGTDVFIKGDNPTKLDNAVYDAISRCDIEFARYPYVYRWRHMVGLYSDEERNSWPSALSENEDDTESAITCSFKIGHITNARTSTPIPKRINQRKISTIGEDSAPDLAPSSPSRQIIGTVFNPIAMLTPRSNNLSVFNRKDNNKLNITPPLQMSKWMRVTGPNSPRSAFVNKNFRPNVSFGF